MPGYSSKVYQLDIARSKRLPEKMAANPGEAGCTVGCQET